jgi:hypothetical protein
MSETQNTNGGATLSTLTACNDAAHTRRALHMHGTNFDNFCSVYLVRKLTDRVSDGPAIPAAKPEKSPEYDAFCVAPVAHRPGHFRVWLFWKMAYGYGQKTLTTGTHCSEPRWDDDDKARRYVVRTIGAIAERPELLR